MSKYSIALNIKLLAVLAFIILFTAPFVAAATDNIVNGVITGEDQQISNTELVSGILTILPPPTGATVINFDDKTQPCNFIETNALTTEYLATKGVTFAGPGGNNGGAVLNECGNFGVTGHSKPNFLAFNTGASLSNGGIPKGPETITFSSVVSHVQINAGSFWTGQVTMTAYDANNIALGSDSKAGGMAALDTLVIQKPGIKKVIIQFTGSQLVLDDLAFLSVASPSVSIVTDKPVYSPGSKMMVSVGIKNPTKSSVTADVNVYLKSTDLGLNEKKASKRLTMPSGFHQSINKSIPIGNLGSNGFSATWYIEMRETVSPYKLISEASATWQYRPVRAASELKPDDIANALSIQLFN